VRWSGRGAGRERVANGPYVARAAAESSGTEHAAPAVGRRRARQDRSPSVYSNSSADEPNFIYNELSSGDAGAKDYLKYVGRLFDDDEDGGTFKIISVCDMQRVRARRSTNVVYAFKYIDINGDPQDFLYTPVREMLNSYWCKWKVIAT
jgi:hypothetical protein